MDGRLQGKVALITGAGAGLGRVIARRFASEGAAIVVADVNEPDGRETVTLIQAAGGRAVFFQVDVANSADMLGLPARALSQFPTLDVVVNNAGAAHAAGPLLDVDEATFDRLLAVNVRGLYLSARAFVPHFRAQGAGAFINITASTLAQCPQPELTWLSGSAAAVVACSQAMAAELLADGIRVNCVSPGLADGDDVASACVYLASDEAARVTGSCLAVEGDSPLL